MRLKVTKPTLIDRMVAALSPELAYKRAVYRSAYSAMTGVGYLGGKRNRRATQSWRPGGGAADSDILPDLPELRERSRDAVRNNPIAAGALSRTATLTVGSGLLPMPRVDRDLLRLGDDASDAWERAAAREFELWACSYNCDATRIQSFYGLQDLVFRGTIESGDCFVLPRYAPRPGSPYGLAIQVYEGDQVSNPNGTRDGSLASNGNQIAGGVELDSLGAPVAYWVQNQHPGRIGMQPQAREWKRVPAFSGGRRLVWHLYRRLRIGATRGVPDLSPVIEPLKQLTTYSQAELFAAVIGSMITVVHKSKTGQQLPNVNPTEETGALPSDKDLKFAPGIVLDLDSEDELTVPPLGRPNANFDPFFVSIVRQIGAALDIPFEVLMMHFTASYSASRAALEMAWQFIRGRRVWIADAFCQPCYAEVIEEAVAMGRLPAPGFFEDPLIRRAWLGCEWIGNGRISVDPLKENEADEIAEDRGWKTSEEITAERTGGDWEQKHRQRVKEVKMRRAGGLDQAERAGAVAPSPAETPGGDKEEKDAA